jgi:tetratricopeptide (TPR) repeat protein
LFSLIRAGCGRTQSFTREKRVPLLRINQQPGGAPNRFRIDVEATGIPGRSKDTFSREIEFELTPQDGERIRWYLEDYLQFDEDPAPKIAHEVEAFMAACGEKLFANIFEGSNPAILLWGALAPHLSSTRIEITTGILEATAIPWELIRNPHTRTFLALSADSFVRTQREAQGALTPTGEAEKVRILLVICRPGGGRDVPFRSVAGRLVTRLSGEARDTFDIDVLRPPTYEQLATTLRLAKERGEPYHVVHFDGHGTYAKADDLATVGSVFNSVMLKGEGSGPRGFLAFEDPANEKNSKFVDGLRLGALLRDEGVPVLVLNACQSAFAEASAKPAETGTETRDEVEAYGSLAQAVMEAGAAGVVAMRYSVYVVTAAQFVAELYGALARGRRLGEAVSWARKNLSEQPERRIAYEARPLQDWPVPLVWEREPLRLWGERKAPEIVLEEGAGSNPGALDRALPERPDIGFFGRDETLYALDRAFDAHRTVLLHAYAGSGKTSTAAEFARWYALTGGVEGPVLFSSFERHLPLARLLDKIGEVFGRWLSSKGIEWDAVTRPGQRRKVALDVLRQVPVLWIWDNVEPVTGFPAGTASDWSAAEQQELRAFLSAARDGKAKFLLTSRRDEQAWLGNLVRRVEVPEMPMQERLQLAGAIADKSGRRLADLPDLRPLLRFTRGNPLTILVTVSAALNAGIDTSPRLDAFVAALHAGEVDFADEASEGRSRSLGASLSYGFGTAFSEDNRRILALLHLFQGFVGVHVLRLMGDLGAEWCLDAVRGLTHERGIALLDRAAEIGLLAAHGGGYYGIHPALPWYFRVLFERYFPEGTGDAVRARHAFVEAMGQVGNFYFGEYEQGRREVLASVAAEEDNLLAAWRLARADGWWRGVIGAMQGLRTLYDATGRRAARRRLVEDVVPEFVDPATDGPLPGRAGYWSLVTEYRVGLAREARDWLEAERLLSLLVDRNRQIAQSALAVAPERWDAMQRHVIRSLATSLHELAEIRREQGSPTCVEPYREAFDFAAAIGDSAGQAACSLNLGHAYKDIADLRDLDEAERWYRQSLGLRSEGDELGRGRSLGQLGLVAHERFLDARKAQRPVEELAGHLAEAAQRYEQALGLIPASAIADHAVTHNQLGNIYDDSGYIDRALHHYRQCIRYREQAGDSFGAGRTRYNVALTLLPATRFSEARAYAVAALENFRTFGDRAADDIQSTEGLIADIDEAIAKQSGAG